MRFLPATMPPFHIGLGGNSGIMQVTPHFERDLTFCAPKTIAKAHIEAEKNFKILLTGAAQLFKTGSAIKKPWKE